MTEMASKSEKRTQQTASDGEEIQTTKPTVAAEAEAPAEGASGPETAAEETPENVAAAPSPEDLLAAKEAEVADLQNQILYLHSELENFKKRTEKRYREALEFASEPLLKDFLPVLDNLDRAVDHGREVGAEGVEALLAGLDQVIQQFREVLGRHGVEPVATAEEKFDPAIHEAMAHVPGEEDGRVGDVYEKGYTFKGRLLRPAKVTITKVASGQGDG